MSTQVPTRLLELAARYAEVPELWADVPVQGLLRNGAVQALLAMEERLRTVASDRDGDRAWIREQLAALVTLDV